MSPFLFAIVIDVLSKDVRKGAPWELLFADDLAITAETDRRRTPGESSGVAEKHGKRWIEDECRKI